MAKAGGTLDGGDDGGGDEMTPPSIFDDNEF
eukprot:CAMPEP_0171046948 /NCGR_PEP_ID=MMETSP0736-20130129/49906_1 /TAXON_ID=186038 /ORGANISM="Fragilariopsis kerguelensis, Strain L26-C5" /LENGTH=30 /DNA_ID= /DNA_START= /DNA_END= /DNA_ORIENTATION=